MTCPICNQQNNELLAKPFPDCEHQICISCLVSKQVCLQCRHPQFFESKSIKHVKCYQYYRTTIAGLMMSACDNGHAWCYNCYTFKKHEYLITCNLCHLQISNLPDERKKYQNVTYYERTKKYKTDHLDSSNEKEKIRKQKLRHSKRQKELLILRRNPARTLKEESRYQHLIKISNRYLQTVVKSNKNSKQWFIHVSIILSHLVLLLTSQGIELNKGYVSVRTSFDKSSIEKKSFD